MDDNSLAHSRYNCTYHIVFIPALQEMSVLNHREPSVHKGLGAFGEEI